MLARLILFVAVIGITIYLIIKFKAVTIVASLLVLSVLAYTGYLVAKGDEK